MNKCDWANVALCAAERSATAHRLCQRWGLPHGEWRRLLELMEAEKRSAEMAIHRWRSMRTQSV